jgi:hypothetical protein
LPEAPGRKRIQGAQQGLLGTRLGGFVLNEVGDGGINQTLRSPFSATEVLK